MAEHDTLLLDARIETNTFSELFKDKVDLVPGTKGSGKSSLYRILSESLKPTLLKYNIVVITGVEATGDPVFQAYKDKFEELSELEFENFWCVYFVSLVLEDFIKNNNHADRLSLAKSECDKLLDKCRLAKIPELNEALSIKGLVEQALRCVKWRFGAASATNEGMELALLEAEPVDSEPVVSVKEPLFLRDIHDAIIALLKKTRLKIWILLDRLDEVFPRRTRLEKIALRSLLKVTRNFPTEAFRIKLFIRDDIFENVILAKDGFTALSHIEARRASTLRWSASEMQLLLVKRLALNPRVGATYSLNQRLLTLDHMDQVQGAFDRLFAPQIRPGKNQSSTMNWIYHHCADGRGVVTPRDVIDLLEFAIKAQIRILQKSKEIPSYFVGPIALKEALLDLSAKKCRVYLEAEFPEFWPHMKRFQDSKAEHNQGSIEKLIGTKGRDVIEDLIAIGFISARPKTQTYIIPYIFRAGLGIRQGKAFNGHS